jgi:Domain of unknown function (DUF222)
MFDEDIAGLDASQTLSRVAELRTMSELADRSILSAAAHWADLHGVVDEPVTSLPGMERLVQLGGDGTPQVAEFAAAELGAELGVSPYAAALLIADALDLRHRLPVTWARVCAGQVKPWIARRVAQATRELSAAAVRAVDVTVARWADRLTWSRLAGVVEAAVVQADPAGAQAVVDADRHDQGVWVAPSSVHGSKTVFIRADAADVIWFDATIDRIADGIGLLGDTASKETRRARAVGIIANPQQSLTVFDQAAAVSRNADPADLPADVTRGDQLHPAETEEGDGPAEAGGLSTGGKAAGVDPRPPATLYVHVDADTFRGGGGGVARVEGVGPVTVEQARRWLGHCAVTVKPVIDLAGLAPVDGYEIPDRLREAVRLVCPADVFPYASNTSRRLDLDHTTA